MHQFQTVSIVMILEIILHGREKQAILIGEKKHEKNSRLRQDSNP